VVGISRLYCNTVSPTDRLRYGDGSSRPPTAAGRSSAKCKPVVVFNCTRRCNLRCIHCYSASTSEAHPDELTTREAAALLDDLADFGAPVVLFSGGEPLLRDDLADLVARARDKGLRAVVSTNGTLIDTRVARKLADAGTSYAGVSLDGLAEVNDAFRGVGGAFEKAVAGIRHCRDAGIKVGLRLTMTRENVDELPAVFDLIERERIPRACFYHLVASGRGGGLANQTLSHERTREALDLIIDRTAAAHADGRPIEVLTVGNHADGPYLYLRLLREDASRAADVIELLRANGGNASGARIACVSWNGDVHPDQFWRNQVLGNVRRRRFSEIWADPDQPLPAKLRDRKKHLKCRCTRCRFLDVCNGNLRARAEAATGDIWGDDPACYLTEEEIAPTEQT